MRFLQPIALLLGAVMYTGIIAWAVQLTEDSIDHGTVDPTWVLVTVGVWNLLFLIATVLAIVDSVLRIRAGKTRQLAVDAMVVKLASIPFFLLNFAVLVFLFNTGVVLIFLGPFLWAVVAIGSVLTYLTMLSTSVKAWVTITHLRGERMIGTGLTVLYAIMCFLFVTDIAAAVLLFGHSRRRPRLALVWLFLGSGMALIVVGTFDSLFGFLGYVVPILGFIAVISKIDWLEWGTPIIAGSLVILVTGMIAVVRRSALRLEAQRAANAVDASTETNRSDLVPL